MPNGYWILLNQIIIVDIQINPNSSDLSASKATRVQLSFGLYPNPLPPLGMFMAYFEVINNKMKQNHV
jgi:hypothetical protein